MPPIRKPARWRRTCGSGWRSQSRRIKPVPRIPGRSPELRDARRRDPDVFSRCCVKSPDRRFIDGRYTFLTSCWRALRHRGGRGPEFRRVDLTTRRGACSVTAGARGSATTPASWSPGKYILQNSLAPSGAASRVCASLKRTRSGARRHCGNRWIPSDQRICASALADGSRLLRAENSCDREMRPAMALPGGCQRWGCPRQAVLEPAGYAADPQRAPSRPHPMRREKLLSFAGPWPPALRPSVRNESTDGRASGYGSTLGAKSCAAFPSSHGARSGERCRREVLSLFAALVAVTLLRDQAPAARCRRRGGHDDTTHDDKTL